MEEKELTLKEVFERIHLLFGYDETEKVTEFGMRSLINDVFTIDEKISKANSIKTVKIEEDENCAEC